MSKLTSFFPHLDLYESLKKTKEKSKKTPAIKRPKIYNCSSCGLDKGCKTPKMSGAGSRRAKIMLIGEAPGRQEDLDGIPFVGESGQILRAMLNRMRLDPERDCFICNVCNCRPPDNATPESHQILACYPFLEKEILEIKPEIIVLLGAVALEALTGEKEISKYRGFLIPFPKYKTILLPTNHPAMITRNRETFEISIWKDLQKLLIYKPFHEYDLNTYEENNTILTDTNEIRSFLKSLPDVYAFDIENYPLKPFSDDAEILTFAFAPNYKESYTFDMNLEVVPDLKLALEKDSIKIIHNYKHEYAWLKKILGITINHETVIDTMYLSYLLNETKGIHSLEFQCSTRLGIHKVENPYKTDMRKCPYDLKHRYAGTDAKLHFRLKDILYPKIKKYRKLIWVYENLMMPGAWATTESEMHGALIDEKRIDELEDEYSKRIGKIIQEIHILPEVKIFKREVKETFNIRSSKDVVKVMQDYCKIESTKTTKKTKKYAIDSEVLEQFQDNNKFCKLLLEYRDIYKASSTYLKGIRKHISNDGLIHTNFNLHTTETGRSSSDSPNLQNIDKRQHPEIRTIFPALKGQILISFDYDGAEVRGACIVSKDRYLENAILSGIDIHQYWAGRIWKKQEITTDKRYLAKNQFVFPLIYGASYKTIADALGLSHEYGKELYDEFFNKLSGLHAWQKEQKRFYMRNGYVETLFGRRRRAPLSHNQLINSPIQSLMSDFTLLSHIKANQDGGDLIVLNIHDDLTLYTKFDKMKETYERIKGIMTGWRFSWMNINLEIECKVGETWGEMEVYHA